MSEPTVPKTGKRADRPEVQAEIAALAAENNLSPKRFLRRGWIVLFALLFCGVIAVMNQFQVPVFMNVLIKDYFPESPGDAGWLMSVIAIAAIVMAYPSSILLSRFGPKPIGAVGLGVMVIGAGIGALSTSAGMLIFGRILTGAGVAVMGVIATTIISMYFPREKAGVPMGLWNLWYTVGATLAYNIGVPICVAFTGNPESWHVWWWFCDAASLVAFVVFLLIVRVPKFATAKRNVAAQSNDKQAQISEENKESDSKSENPSDGLGNNVAESQPDSSSSNGGISGVQATSVDAAIASRNEANNRHRHEVKAGKASTDSTSKSGEIKSYKSDSIGGSFRLLIEGWKVPRMWLLGISYACLMFTSLAVLSWVPTYAQDVETARLIAQGVSHADAAMRAAESSGALASIGFASSIPTSLVTAWLLGRFPHIKSRNIMLMIASALGFLYVGAYLIPFDWLPWWLVLLGIESGWTSGVVWALVPLTMPKPSTITVGMATITCATGVSNLLATPIVGYLIGAHDIWTNVPPLLICTACVGVVLCFIYIRTKPPVFEERE